MNLTKTPEQNYGVIVVLRRALVTFGQKNFHFITKRWFGSRRQLLGVCRKRWQWNILVRSFLSSNWIIWNDCLFRRWIGWTSFTFRFDFNLNILILLLRRNKVWLSVVRFELFTGFMFIVHVDCIEIAERNEIFVNEMYLNNCDYDEERGRKQFFEQNKRFVIVDDQSQISLPAKRNVSTILKRYVIRYWQFRIDAQIVPPVLRKVVELISVDCNQNDHRIEDDYQPEWVDKLPPPFER